MKICIEIPPKMVKLAEAVMMQQATGDDETRLEEAVKKCTDGVIEIPPEMLSEVDDKDLKEMYLAFAMIGISIKLQEVE